MADAPDLGSGKLCLWGFKSPLSHHSNKRKEKMFEIIKEETNERTVKFTEGKKEVQRVFANIRKSISKEMDIPGFRPGKVPQGLIERKYGNFIIAEAGDAIRKKLTGELIDEKDWILEDTDFDKDQTLPTDGEDYTFEIVFSLFETPEPQGYESIEVKIPPFDIDNALIEAMEGIQKRMVTYSPVERVAQDGDFVHLKATSDNEPEDSSEFDIIIGDERVGPGFDELLTGLSVGSAFKAKMSDNSIEEENTQPAHTFEVLEVSEPVLPELNDEFAKNVNVDTIEKLRSQIRENIETRHEEESKNLKDMQVIQTLLDNNKFDPPEYMINNLSEDYLARLDDDNSDEKVAEAVRTMAAKKVREFLILRAIAEKEDIQVTTDEIADAKSPEEYESSVADRLRNEKTMQLILAGVKIKEEAVEDESSESSEDNTGTWKWVLAEDETPGKKKIPSKKKSVKEDKEK